MELRTERVLGKGRARVTASVLLGDIEHNLKTKANSQWEFLRYGSSDKFDAYNKMSSSERIDAIIKEDHQAARDAIMADAILLYLERLKEGM